jgi:hypothetical protein
MRNTLVLGFMLAAVAPLAATGNDALVKFRGGIGVDPVSSIAANGTVMPNIVRGVSPPGQPWRIADLKATVTVDGRIKVEGHGLLLAGGNGIGTSAGLSVVATLFCGPAATASAHSSNPAGVALEADGDFSIEDFLSPHPPDPCTTPVLLIRAHVASGGPGSWLAGGIPRLEE